MLVVSIDFIATSTKNMRIMKMMMMIKEIILLMLRLETVT